MKKPAKLLTIIVSVIVVIVLVVLAGINVFADLALKIGIETAATRALNVGVSVDDVDLSILGGKLDIANLSINNPPGYQHDKLLKMKSCKVQVSVGSLLSDTIKVKEFNLDGIDLVIEQKNITNNNIRDIINSISAQREKEQEPDKKAAPSGKKIQIEKLRISNVTVKAKLLPVPGKADTVTLKLSPIEMNNLGSDGKLDGVELSRRILLALADGVAREGAGILPKNLTDTMKSALDRAVQLGGTAAEGGKKLIGTGKDVIDTGKDIGKEVTEGLKGLFKPKEKD